MPNKEMALIIRVTGEVQCIYNEKIDISALGPKKMQRRMSYVEPFDGLSDKALDYIWRYKRDKYIEATMDRNSWWADLTIIDGPVLGPFGKRSQALEAEIAWLEKYVLLNNNRKEKCV